MEIKWKPHETDAYKKGQKPYESYTYKKDRKWQMWHYKKATQCNTYKKKRTVKEQRKIGQIRHL